MVICQNEIVHIHFNNVSDFVSMSCLDLDLHLIDRPIRYHIKGTNTVFFSISFHIINQKPIIPRTDFHYKTTRIAHSSGRNSTMPYYAL